MGDEDVEMVVAEEDEKARRKREKKEQKERKRKAKAEFDTIISEPIDIEEKVKDSRPRKRRKLSLVSEPEEVVHIATDRQSPSPSQSSHSRSLGPEVQLTRDQSTPPPNALPSFPLPTRPNVPLKSELASQGLDRALAQAQLVDPSLSTPISFEETEDDQKMQTGLSLRTRNRLKELGIEELFAGM